MKTWIGLLWMTAGLAFGAPQERQICVKLAPTEEGLKTTQEKLCLSTYLAGGIEVGNLDITYYAPAAQPPRGKQPPPVPFAKLSYRSLTAIPDGELSLILIERYNSPFTELFKNLRFVVFSKDKKRGETEIGEVSIGAEEGEGKHLFYQRVP